jgi:hypothetical protein
VPNTIHRGAEVGRATIEVTGMVVEQGLEEAWDRAKDFRLHNPTIKVPW